MDTQPLPNLAQLWKFLHVVEQGSITRAAAALLTSQPALTRAIHDLEDQLQVTVFERGPNGILLTDAGQVVHSRTRRVFAELKGAAEASGGGGHSPPNVRHLLNNRRLQIFVALRKSHQMQVVGRQFNLTQPAISLAIKNIEAGSGVALFERTSRGMQPTRTAVEMAYPIQRALTELRHIQADVDYMKGVLGGVVHIGALPLGRTRILPEAVIRVVTKHPAIQVVTSESDFPTLANGMRAGDIDMIFGALREEADEPECLGEPLLVEKMAVLARRDHPLVGASLRLEQLLDYEWVLPRRDSPARHLLDGQFAAANLFSPRPIVETGDLAMIRGLLLRSDMIAAVSEHQLEHEIDSGELVPLPVELDGTYRTLGLTYRRNWLPSPAAQALAESIRSVIAERGGEGGTGIG